ncbi:MAG: type II secretion system GspH family protein [Polyangiaceae bacterium]|jgi:general secretion pathway protein I|nr:type II secretion system GspH family protein [Polyangiaceae bacterium]
MGGKRGFTLLEIMVAVAILGLALTVILSAQAGLYAAGTHVHRETIAIGLTRCKMAEIEEGLFRTGYSELDAIEDGPCCEDQTPDGFSCKWKIERVELPQPPTFGEMDAAGGAGLNLGGASSAGSLPGGAGAIGALLNAGSNDAGALLSAVGDGGGFGALSSMLGGATAGGVSGLAPMVMGIVYPSLKPMLESSIRKITVQVLWKEGIHERDLSIVQYVTNPMRGGFRGDVAGMGSADFESLPGGPGASPADQPPGDSK